MNTFWLKILLMPLIIALVTLASRRWGNVVGGVIAGMPWVGGAVLLFIAIEQGESFAWNSLRGVMVGLISWLGFCVSYMIAGQRFKAFASMIISMLVFLCIGALLMNVTNVFSPIVWFVILLLMISIVLKFFPKVKDTHKQVGRPIKFEIPMRMFMITAFVLALTYSANLLGPTWSGILTPFPVITAVLAVFTHYGQGMQQVRLTFMGMFTGVFGFSTFLISLVYLLPAYGIGISFAVALLINVVAALIAKVVFGKLGVV